MSTSISRGYTFSTGLQDDVTADHLHALVSSALATAHAVSEFATASHVLQVSATTPASDQGDGSVWFDKTLMVMRSKNGSRWDAQAVGPEMLNSSGSTIPAGSLVVASADDTMALCMTAGWPEAIGVTVAAVNNSARGVVRRGGIGLMALAGPCTVGDTLIAAGAYTSWSTGRARSAREAGSTTVTAGIEVGICLTQIGATTSLATALVWR